MIPKGISLLQGKRRSFSYTVKELNTCCEQHDPRCHGCGFTGLCRTLFDKRDDDWDWQRRFSSNKWWSFTPAPTKGSDWLAHSIPGMGSSNRGGAM